METIFLFLERERLWRAGVWRRGRGSGGVGTVDRGGKERVGGKGRKSRRERKGEE